MKTQTPRNPRRGTRGKKAQYRVRNWHDCDAALVQRGSLGVWLSEDVLAAWYAAPTHRQGAQRVYSDAAIEATLTLRSVFRLPLRATEGFLRSVLQRSGVTLRVPDASTLSRRGQRLHVLLAKKQRALSADEPLVLVVDSTGVKLYGEGEWKVRQHGKSKRRKWKKIHIAVDEKGEVHAVDVTDQDVHDANVAPKLLAQEAADVSAVIGDGAYDREPVYGTCAARGITRILVPPRKDAKIQRHGNTHGPPRPRDETLRCIRKHGRAWWKRTSGYHTRSLVENVIFRFKTIFGDRLRSREDARQVTEMKLAVNALNRMFQLGMPESYAVTA